MKDILKRLRWRLEYGALFLVFTVARLVPWQRTAVWGRRLGLAVYRFLPIRRSVVEANLNAAFSDNLGGDEIARIVQEFYANLGITLLEFCAFDRIDPSVVLQVTEAEGVEHLEACRATGRGGLLVSGHYGNWELLGAAVAARGFPIKFLVKSQSNPYVDGLQTRLRGRVGIGIIREGPSVRELVYAVRRGELIGLLGDQNAGGSGYFMNFLGRPASVFRGTAYFAYRLRCPIIPSFIQRKADGCHRVVFQPPIEVDPAWDEETAIRELTVAHMRRLEEAIRERPEHYFWVHRRWKTPPPAGWQPDSSG